MKYVTYRGDAGDRVQYTDEAAYQAHGQSEHFQRLGFGDAIPHLESRERAFYQTWDI